MDKLKKIFKGKEGKDSSTDAPAPVDPETAVPDDGSLDLNDPSQLAERIRALIDAIPTPTSAPPVPKKPTKPSCDKTGRPIPPAAAARVKDKKLISMLSNSSFMNGSDKDAQSVWSILNSLGPIQHNDTQEGDNPQQPGSGSDSPSTGSDDTSIMLYSPLIPANDSVVELGETEMVDVPSAVAAGFAPDTFVVLSWWPNFWPFSKWGGSAPAPATPPPQVKVWVPSKTKLSFQVMWWGYRMYLPPPVLDILSDQTVEATKRAAMITTALTWFFSNIPVTSLPLPVQPTVLLLQKVVPYLSYIGTFISWSWSTLKSYDIGNGVFLTATWLLPIILIPGTWQSYDFPSPPPTPTPPANPTQTPAAPSTPTPGQSTNPTPAAPTAPTNPSSGSGSTPANPTQPTQDVSLPTSPPQTGKKSGKGGAWRLIPGRS